MKTQIQKLLVCAVLVGAVPLAQAQFNYTNNGDGTCTITKYTGSGGAISIPGTIDGLTVTGFGQSVFEQNAAIASVIIPDSVTNIGRDAFSYCVGMASISIGSGVTGIGDEAFNYCSSLTSATIGNGVSSIGSYAFAFCSSLTSTYFLGNAPNDPGNALYGEFVTVYYLAGADWGPTFSGHPTELWNPQATALSITGGQFGFNITGPSNTVMVVEACTNLANPVWLPVSTNVLNASGASTFIDSKWSNGPHRFYRFRSP